MNCEMFTEEIPGKITGETLREIPGVILGGVCEGIPGGISGKRLYFFLGKIFEEILEKKNTGINVEVLKNICYSLSK